jgi:hypothetical protein
MAAVKDRVRVKLSGGVSAGTIAAFVLQPQPPRIGVVTASGAGLNTVLFENGRVVDTIPDASLDVVENVQNEETIDDLLYSVVRPSGTGASQEYTGIVVDMYLVGVSTLALVKTLRGDLYYEATIGSLIRVDAEGVPQ